MISPTTPVAPTTATLGTNTEVLRKSKPRSPVLSMRILTGCWQENPHPTGADFRAGCRRVMIVRGGRTLAGQQTARIGSRQDCLAPAKRRDTSQRHGFFPVFVSAIPMGMFQSDAKWMHRALELAERGRGYVEPNPLVGAVVVRDGRVVGEGWHERFGQQHAEIIALAAADDAAQGATLYVTLEPCCHQGKTPPCTDAVLGAGIRRVVAAMADPFPQVAGKGVAHLRAAGVEVVVGAEEARARRLNAPYLKLLSTGRPYVHAKWAMSLDGKIATRTGDSKWISSEASRKPVHELRGRMDAVIIGVGTALADDPRLTARPPGPRTPMRIVLDSRGRLPLTSQLVVTARETPTLIVTASAEADRFRAIGCEVLSLPTGSGRPDVGQLLDELGKRRMTNVLVEGGAAVLGSFLDARAMDEVHVFLAPVLIGGTDAKPAIAGQGLERVADALRLADWSSEALAGDFYLHGWVRPN
ncbi:MAG TPA: bifunctional diaminohydroxyphosphoribosylaminopyrimidine deaminase/5-amino-6-(5-phosphoribosylamino)uracil reductase RibD [Gemmataceae bacterium]